MDKQMRAAPPEENPTETRIQVWLRFLLKFLVGSLGIQILAVGFWWKILLYIVILFSVVATVRKRSLIKPVVPWLLLVTSFGLLEKYVGHYYLSLDFAVLILALGIVKSFPLWVPRRNASGRVLQLHVDDLFWVWLLFWVLTSIGDSVLLRTSASLKGSREVPSTGKFNIGVALSGGGYRAALFHAGVLSILEREHLDVTRVSAVSGGAIVGSFYTLGGSPEQFLTLVQRGRFNLRRELFDFPDGLELAGSTQIPDTPYTILPFGRFTRTDAHARMLNRVFGGHRGIHENHGSNQVQLMICVTDILRQEMIGVTAEGLVIHPILPAVDRLHVVNPSHPENHNPNGAYYSSFHQDAETNVADWPVSVAMLVAASAAFPGALRAVPLLDASGAKRGSPTWWWKYNEDLPDDLNLLRRLLADGGIGDNTGLELLKDAHELSTIANTKRRRAKCDPDLEIKERDSPECWELADWESSLFIASDGSAITPIPSYSEGTNTFKEATSAIDVATLGNGGTPSEASRDGAGPPNTVLITPRAILAIPYSQIKIDDADLVDFPIERLPPKGCVFRDFAALLEAYIPPGHCEIRGISMMTLNDATLRFITANMPPNQRSKAEGYLRDLESHGAYDRGTWRVEGWPDDSPQYRLYLLVREELGHCVVAFLQTSTLDDHPSPESAERIFRLGQYLTVINLPVIRNEINRLSTAKPTAP